MTKTDMTRELEKALYRSCERKREYGCAEVTIGFARDGHGDEIVDFLSMDSQGVLKCYELKVSLADLRSEAKKSWYGDYNYLVVSEELWQSSPAWDNYIPPYVGILAGKGLSTKRRAKKVPVSGEQRDMLKDSLIRSLFWRMTELLDHGSGTDREEYREKLAEYSSALSALKEQYERKVWELNDYETYYRRNHQDPGFSAAEQAKTERRQYQKRKKDGFTWKRVRDGYVCPACGSKALYDGDVPVLSDYCPFCGSDLRSLNDEEGTA